MPDEITFPVEAGHIMRFAAAIGDENPIYRDAAHARATEPGAVIAPPTYAVVSSHWDPAVPRPLPGRPWRGSAAGPTGRPGGAGTGASARGLHAEQRYVYHRPARPGWRDADRPQTPRRHLDEGGPSGRQAMTFEEINTISEFYDEAGEIVVTATSVGVTIAPVYPQRGRGRRPYPLRVMLRITASSSGSTSATPAWSRSSTTPARCSSSPGSASPSRFDKQRP